MKRYFNIKSLVLILVIIFNINIMSGCTNKVQTMQINNNQSRVLNYDEVKDSLIRFHVIANSDTEEDQNLKIKVKNEIIDYLYPYLSESESLDESRQIIKDNMPKVKEIAKKVISDNNYDYNVRLQLSRENFPDKSYGNIVLPQGNYEAFRIIIGSGQGKIWWCVMFPPLCFVDESKAEVEYDKVEEKINSKEKDDNVKLKFKIVEVVKDLLK